MTQLGAKIREARLEKKLSQEKLAGLLHVNRRTVGAWETGTNEPSVDMLYRIMDVLGCDANYLFGIN